MKAESNIKPNNYEIENIHKNRCDLILYDNIQEYVAEDETIRYLYDIYRIEICYNVDTEKELSEKYKEYLETAKKIEFEELANEIRNKRDELLAKTDWTQMQDSPLSEEKIEKYKKYRQALRDIPEQKEFPFNVVFPSI